MAGEQTGITALFSSVVRELTITGRFAAFFGTALLLWNFSGVQATKVFAGLSLIFFAFANASWRDRHIGIYYSGEKLRWHQDLIWSKVFWAALFFAVSAILFAVWLRLPPVKTFLSASGIHL
jgi:hypothetical protein